MFYEGDLQSGLAKAVEESKFVACFVTDEGGESQLWQDDFLQEPVIKSNFLHQTVLLRLLKDSREATYLAAIFPLPKTPTLVIIQNGQLREYITSGVGREEFIRRIGAILGSNNSTSPQANTPAQSASTPDDGPVAPAGELSSHSVQSTPPPEQPLAQAPPPESHVVQDLLAERGARLEAQKKEKEAKDQAERAAQAKARREEVDRSELGTKLSADMKYALMQKKRQQEARDDRARILKRVEDDKIERRHKETLRKTQASATIQDTPPATSSRQASQSSKTDCALQVRLLDGSSIRSRFPSRGSLRGDVRQWIDETQGIDSPYNFKHVLTPLPNKNISISEEEESLHSLGLTPNATLILMPVQGFALAYNDSNPGLLTRGVSAGYNLLASGVSTIAGILGGPIGRPTHAQEQISPQPQTSSGPSINIRTLRDQGGQPEDHQLYNGNTLNFQPRKDDDEKED
ncbi:hypothetical protein B7494_g8183 [Chlorociboria aeruginascens]|nr:hypothetical protein B7494_g8183 [Chlorociboria aeruginascens]